MAITQYSRYLPYCCLFLPNHNELKRTAVFFTIFDMAEFVRPPFYGAITVDWINFQAFFYKFSLYAVILFEHFFKIFIRLMVISQTAPVVVEFKIFRKYGFQSFNTMRIKCGRQYAVHIS